MRFLAVPALLALMLVASLAPAHAQDPNRTLVIELSTGKVLIRMRDDLAPEHVKRITQLANEKFYDGVAFHRVIPGFMAQTGDPKGDGTGGSPHPNLRSEFQTKVPFVKGSVGMARTGDPNSANSQFFICYEGCGHLTGDYTLWGEVVSGMEHVEQIVPPVRGRTPDRMLKVYLLANPR